MFRNNMRGFTLVEAVIVTVVIAVILAVTIPWMRTKHHEREWPRVQLIADCQPGTAFTMDCRPASDPMVWGEGLDVVCGITNTTAYDLVFRHGVGLTFSRVGGPAKARRGFESPGGHGGVTLDIKSKQTVDIHFRSGRSMEPGEYPEASVTTILVISSISILYPHSVGNMGPLELLPLESNTFSFRVVAAPLEEPERRDP
jgi:hypothetical protein